MELRYFNLKKKEFNLLKSLVDKYKSNFAITIFGLSKLINVSIDELVERQLGKKFFTTYKKNFNCITNQFKCEIYFLSTRKHQTKIITSDLKVCDSVTLFIRSGIVNPKLYELNNPRKYKMLQYSDILTFEPQLFEGEDFKINNKKGLNFYNVWNNKVTVVEHGRILGIPQCFNLYDLEI